MKVRRNLHPLVLHRSQEASWVLVPAFLQRVAAFSARHDSRHVADVRERFMEDFGAGRGAYLGVALVDEDGSMQGHLLACLEQRNLTGAIHATVWQWEKDCRCDYLVDEQCRQLLEGWAAAKGAEKLVALALTDSRARLFQRYGFAAGPRLITREVQR